jgi:hypothetical protein
MGQTHNLTKEQEIAVAIETAWMDRWLSQYIREHGEPTRAGTPRGEPVGMSRRKRRAAMLTILHSKTFGLRLLSRLAGVSEGFLRVWRTEDEFKSVAKDTCKEFATHIINTIFQEFEMPVYKQNKINPRGATPYLNFEISGIGQKPNLYATLLGKQPSYAILLDVFPHFNIEIFETVMQWLFEKLRTKGMAYVVLMPSILRALATARASKDPREKIWIRHPSLIKAVKWQVSALLSNLTAPNLRKALDDNDAHDLGELLKSIIFGYFDIWTTPETNPGASGNTPCAAGARLPGATDSAKGTGQ